MFYYVAGYYLVMKAVFFFSLVQIQVKFDTMKDHWLFLGILYSAGVAFLSYVFLMSWQEFPWPVLQWGKYGRCPHENLRSSAPATAEPRTPSRCGSPFLGDRDTQNSRHRL